MNTTPGNGSRVAVLQRWLDTAVNIHQAWIVFLFTEIYIKETTVSHKLCPPRAAQKCHREVSLSMPANWIGIYAIILMFSWVSIVIRQVFFSNRIYHINHSQSLTPFPQYLRKKWILGKLMQSKNVCTKDQSKSSSSRCVLNAHDQGPITDVITQ